MGQITIGLTKIELGAILESGGMGTTLAELGLTYQDSCKLTEEDSEDTEFYSEENEDPEYIKSKRGKRTLEWQCMNPDADTLALILGGTATGTPKVWEAPTSLETIEKSIKITLEDGFATIEIPRAKINAKINHEISKKGIMLIDIKATILTPELAGLAPLSYTESA